jgi:hypothetical protein
VTDADRLCPVGLGLIDKPTVPLPLPDEPDVMLIQSDDSVAAQLQPDAAVTVTEAVCPATIALTVFVFTVYEQAPTCRMVKVRAELVSICALYIPALDWADQRVFVAEVKVCVSCD